jgi:hypothetical protein
MVKFMHQILHKTKRALHFVSEGVISNVGYLSVRLHCRSVVLFIYVMDTLRWCVICESILHRLVAYIINMHSEANQNMTNFDYSTLSKKKRWIIFFDKLAHILYLVVFHLHLACTLLPGLHRSVGACMPHDHRRYSIFVSFSDVCV